MRNTPLLSTSFFCIVLFLFFPASQSLAGELAEDERDSRIEELEQSVQQLSEQLRLLQEERIREREQASEENEALVQLTARVDEMSSFQAFDSDSWLNKFELGGYGEFHANFEKGDSGDQFDIHRLVLYLGYDFNDWIKFHSETEIEHAFVSGDSGGELVIEQAYFDFLLSDLVNVRVGRILTPLGIINKKHEPPSFYGVERPSFARFIIPTTWSSDGVGVFGSLTPSLKYEAYVVSGLDGSEFNAIEGIRGGRIKERPSLNDVAFTGRLDYYPFAQRSTGYNQWLRLGLSTYLGGLDNGNKGDDPDIDGDIQIYSGDFEYSVSRFDFRGAIAFEQIDGARDIGNGTAEEIFGWYVEAAYHFWPEAWRRGKLNKSDAAAFVRFDDFDTQHKMPSGVARNPDGDREEWTFGLSFYVTPNMVLKADYQVRDSAGEDSGNAFNLGLGWQF